MTLQRREKLLLTLLAAATLLAAGEAYRLAASPYRGYDGASAIVIIPPGAGPASVAAAVGGAGVVRSALHFRLLARLAGVSRKLQAGEYLFDRPMTPAQVLERIVRGDVLLHRLTIPEGLDGGAIIVQIARARLAPAGDLERAFRDAAAVRIWDAEARDLEGYLFPDTYHFARGTAASRILEAMVGRFQDVFDASLRARAAEIGMTSRQVVTLASLIEKETSAPSERERISAVFHNRLRAGMPLQCDPTVIFALASAGRYRGDLSREDLSFDSPYNTYRNGGLPPGPIASPGRASLVAALYPAPVRDLYFVANGSGGHDFSVSLEDHMRAVAHYRRIRKGGA